MWLFRIWVAGKWTNNLCLHNSIQYQNIPYHNKPYHTCYQTKPWYTIPSYHPYHVIPYHIPYHAISCHTISPSIPYHAIYHHTLPTPRHHMWMKNEALYWPWWWTPVILALGSPKQKMICSKLCFRNKRTIITSKKPRKPKDKQMGKKPGSVNRHHTPHSMA